MKVTKEKLQKIIQEELAAMQQEGELEEGFLDRLFGKDKRSNEFVSDEEVKSVINNVINSITDLVRTASRQDNRNLADKAAELKRTAMSLSALSTPSGNTELPDPVEFTKGTPKLPSSIDRGGRLARQRKLSESKRKASK